MPQTITNRKNKIPTAVPNPIFANTFGMVINISAGPAFKVSAFPPEKANTAGIIIRPAMIAIAVSKISTFWVVPQLKYLSSYKNQTLLKYPSQLTKNKTSVPLQTLLSSRKSS